MLFFSAVQSVPGSLPVILQMVDIPVINHDECKAGWPAGWVTDEYAYELV